MSKSKTIPCPFGKIVVDARTAQGISRYRLAKRIGRTPQQLAKLERGENEPVLSTIVMIARALNVDPCVLFRQTIEMMSSESIKNDISKDKEEV